MEAVSRFLAPDGHWFEIYRGDDGRWRWHVKAKNGRIVGASEQGYRSKYYASLKAHLAARQYR